MLVCQIIQKLRQWRIVCNLFEKGRKFLLISQNCQRRAWKLDVEHLFLSFNWVLIWWRGLFSILLFWQSLEAYRCKSRSICPSNTFESRLLVIECYSRRKRIFFPLSVVYVLMPFFSLKIFEWTLEFCAFIYPYFSWLFCFYHLFECFRCWSGIFWFQWLYT